MRDIREFNPYITYVNHGELLPKMVVDERMLSCGTSSSSSQIVGQARAV